LKLVAPLEVGIAVEDLDLMLSFYRDVLGLKYVSLYQVPPERADEATMSASGYRIIRLQTDTGERIKLAQPGSPPPKPQNDDEVLSTRGLAFLTFIVDDLRAMISRLEERGVPVRTGPDMVEVRDGVYLAFAQDPEGNLLEFVEYSDLPAYRSDL